MVKPTPARIAEPWIWPQRSTRRCDTDLLANEQAEQDSQAYGIGERLDDSGVHEDTAIEPCDSGKIT